MFVSRGLSCHCVLFSVCVYPPCVKMVLATRCIYVHCSVLLGESSLVRYVHLCGPLCLLLIFVLYPI